MTFGQTSSASAFVLVHGAWHGGWCWARLAPLLAATGHSVWTPTCTGLGERAHLLSWQVGLDTFIQDVVALIEMEDLTDIVLVGHSFGGNVISGVADRLPGRIAHLVYLDATVVEPGQSPFSILAPDLVEGRRRAAENSSGGLTLPVPPASAFGVTDPADVEWLARHLRPHPIKTYEDVLHLDHPVGNGRPKTYVACTRPEYAPLAPVRERIRRDAGWAYKEIATGHDAMVTAPAMLAELLLGIG